MGVGAKEDTLAVIVYAGIHILHGKFCVYMKTYSMVIQFSFQLMKQGALLEKCSMYVALLYMWNIKSISTDSW